jgi:hypothetical protein
MKCICTLKGLDITVKVIEAGSVCTDTVNNGDKSLSTMIKSNFAPVADFTFKIEESTSDIEMDKEEFIEVNRLITEDGQLFRDNCLIPFVEGLDKYADRCLTALEAQWAQTLEENRARAEKEINSIKA